MVMLREGISMLKKLLQTKICRQVGPILKLSPLLIADSADLGVTLATGCKTLFFSDGLLVDSYIASQGRVLIGAQYPHPDSPIGRFLDSLDKRLHLVWDDLSEFARAANIATQFCKLSIDSDLYLEVMVSILLPFRQPPLRQYE